MNAGPIAAAALLATFSLSLLLPFDPAASGGAGFYLALLSAGISAAAAGAAFPAARGAFAGAAAGVTGLCLFLLGNFIAYSSGWFGLAWDDFGESLAAHRFVLLAALLAVYGPIAAVLGALLGYIGSRHSARPAGPEDRS